MVGEEVGEDRSLHLEDREEILFLFLVLLVNLEEEEEEEGLALHRQEEEALVDEDIWNMHSSNVIIISCKIF
jgi:hypothetical protein